jgi:hypothetical protein
MMEPIQRNTSLASENPTIMVSDHSTTGTLDTTSQMRRVDTTVEEDRGWSHEATPAAKNLVPEHVTHGQDPEGQQRSNYKHLGTLLRRCGIEHADCTQGNIKLFWPTPLLKQILTKARIIEELDAPTQNGCLLSFHRSSFELTNQILAGRIKIFAVLLLLDQVQCIERALTEGLEDSNLPFEPRGDNSELFRASGSHSLQLVKCFSGPDWKIHERDSFSNYQQAVDPRILKLEGDGRTPKHEEFHSKAVLPFMHEIRQGVPKMEREYGGFGVVSVVKIHPQCHKFHNLLDSVRTHHHTKIYEN